MKNKRLSTEDRVRLLSLPLTSFNIRPINSWVTRIERKRIKSLQQARNQLGIRLDESHAELMEISKHFNKLDTEQPKTVGQLIEKYYYRFPPHKYCGVGIQSINELKQKLVKLGLTPDDWPALVPHNELLQHLSKESILKLPLRELLSGRHFYLHHYLGRTERLDDNFSGVTVGDFIRINPLHEPKDAIGLNFLKEHRRFLVALRQQLVGKGFTKKDGGLFEWNPREEALGKARERLRKYKLEPALLEHFSEIVVMERWVI